MPSQLVLKPHAPSMSPELKKGVLRRFGQLALQLVLTGALLFACAGSVAWVQGWLYLATAVASMGLLAVWVLPRSPEVIAERGRLHKDTATFDKVLLPIYTLCSGAVYVVGALDNGRYGWAPLSWQLSLAGVALMLASAVPVGGAMLANKHLSTTVHLEPAGRHELATTGPYSVVRHPMYAAALVQHPAIALVLGSAWALVPAAAAWLVIVVRTALEDRKLRKELPGYEEYARQTKYRLLPGLW